MTAMARIGSRVIAAAGCVVAAWLGLSALATADTAPAGGTVTLADFAFADGETLPALKLHYLTLGTPTRDAAGHVTNAVLLLHGTTGSATQFTERGFSDALYGPGQPLDATRFFLVIPDGIGAGASSKPSDGLHARFPRYGYRDQVRAAHDMLERIGVTHLKLVLGTSMGGMQAWLWGETYPRASDALVAVASTPAPISGRNMMWRQMISEAIRQDPDWRGGDYPGDAPPRAWARTVMPLFTIMTGNAWWTRSRRAAARATPTTRSTRSRVRPTTTRRPNSPRSSRRCWRSTSPTTCSTRPTC